MKNKIKDKFVPLESSNSTKHLDLTKMQRAPDMSELKSSTVKDLSILDKKMSLLNKEALEVLEFQN